MPARNVESTFQAGFAVLDALPLMIAYVGHDQHFQYANRAFAADAGLPAERIVGRSLREHLGAAAYATVLPHVLRVLGGEDASFTFEIQPEEQGESAAGRSERLLRAKCTPDEADGAVAGFFMVIEDITEQTRARRNLADAAEFFRDIAASVPGVAFQYERTENDSGRFNYLSPQLEDWIGLDCELVMADPTKLKACIHPDDVEGLRASVESAWHRRGTWSWRGRILAPDGRHIFAQGIARPRHAADGHVVWSGILLDISEQKQVERVLKETAAFFHDIATTIPGIVYRFVQDEDGTRRFDYISPQLADITGLKPQDVIADANAYLDRIHPDDRPAFEESVAQSAKTLQLRTWEGRIRSGGSGYNWVRGASLPRRQRDGSIVWNGVVLDVTDHKVMEQKLREAQKMEAVGQLTGGLAHDFNNLLAVIGGNLELLEDDLAESPRERSMASKARQAAMRGSDVTQRLLAFARRQPLSPRVIDLNLLVRRTTELLEHALGPGIEVATAPLAARHTVRVDPGQLENALINLAMNARDAMPDGGVVTVETADVELDSAYAREHPDVEPGRYAVLSVSDTGVGMPQESIDKAFEPFFTTKPPDKGTGLGLPMVYGFLKQSGGHASVHSKVGEGTTVRLYLPHANEDATSVPASAPSKISTRANSGEVVLLVDNEPDLRAAIAEMLAGAGYGLRVADDGLTALAQLEAAPRVDLLLTDVVLDSRMNGRELAETARSRRNLAVLCMSGFTGDVPDVELQAISDAPMLRKPFCRRELGRRVREAIDSRNFRSR
jgi:PAS domain S-box-containing protein